jgi:hypothetical protein
VEKDEYTVEFISDPAKLEAVDWKTCEVKAFVRPFSGAALVPVGIDGIVDVSDDSNGLLAREPARVVDVYFARCDVNIDRNKLNQLDENSAPFTVSLRVKVDPSKSMLGPAMIPVPGVVQALTATGSKEVEGKVKLKVEFPPPYIWHPYTAVHSESEQAALITGMTPTAIPKPSQISGFEPPNTFLLLDPRSEEPYPCKLELRKFLPSQHSNGQSGYIAVEDESLQVELKFASDDWKDAVQIKEIRPREVVLETKRLIVAKDEEPVGTIQIRRHEDKKPPARNEPAAIDVRIKGYEVELAIKLMAAKSLWEPFTVIRRIQAEDLKLHWPHLAKGAMGRVQWKILNEHPQMKTSGFQNLAAKRTSTQGFKPIALADVDIAGSKKTGVELQLVGTPITKDIIELPSERDALGAEIDLDETLRWEERPGHWPLEMSGPEAFRALGKAIATEKRFKSKFCDIECAEYVFDRMRKAAAVYQLEANTAFGAATQLIARPNLFGGGVGVVGGALAGFFAPFTGGLSLLVVTGTAVAAGAAGYTIGQHLDDGENCASLKKGPGSRGNCGEWSYAFQAVLAGAGFAQAQVVYATPDPTPGQGPSVIKRSAGYTGTDTAVLLNDTYLGAEGPINVARIFDMFRQMLHLPTNQPSIASTWANCPPTDREVNPSFGPQASWLGGKLGMDKEGKMEKHYIKNVNNHVVYTIPSAPPPPPSVDHD